MTYHKTRKNPADRCSPTEHDVLTMDQVRDFDGWIDQQLRELESRFADFVTQQSTKESLSR